MSIEYDCVLKKWVVWKPLRNAMFMLYSSKLKRDCKAFIKLGNDKSKWESEEKL